MKNEDNNKPATQADISKLERTIQEDIKLVSEIVATKTDLTDGLNKTKGEIIHEIKEHFDKKVGEIKDELVPTINNTAEAVRRFADIFERTHDIKEVDQKDMQKVRELLEVKRSA